MTPSIAIDAVVLLEAVVGVNLMVVPDICEINPSEPKALEAAEEPVKGIDPLAGVAVAMLSRSVETPIVMLSVLDARASEAVFFKLTFVTLANSPPLVSVLPVEVPFRVSVKVAPVASVPVIVNVLSLKSSSVVMTTAEAGLSVAGCVAPTVSFEVRLTTSPLNATLPEPLVDPVAVKSLIPTDMFPAGRAELTI